MAPNHAWPWFYFDRDYYLAACLHQGICAPLGSDQALLEHYVDRGAHSGLSPNPLFDERLYRCRYEQVARGIEVGHWSSAFEHFVEIGAATDLSPAWFFDGQYYKRLHSDLTGESLATGGFRDSYTHYLLVGLGEQRAAHWIIQALKSVQPAFLFPTERVQLASLLRNGAELLDALAPVFDYEWMREQYRWDQSVPPEEWIQFYLTRVGAEGLSPSPYFDEVFYRQHDADIQRAIEDGQFSCGFEHFIGEGMNEWRRPFAGFDPHYYFITHMAATVRRAGPAAYQAPFAHFLQHRADQHLLLAPALAVADIDEDAGKGIYQRRCAVNVPRLAELEFATPGSEPCVSIIIVACNHFEETANCIVSAATSARSLMEVIVFDNGSVDSVRDLPRLHAGIRYIRSEQTLEFALAVNRAAKLARGSVLLLLDHDVELAPAAIDQAVALLRSDPSVGAVGGKVIRMHGRLQEAGSLVWNDGTALRYARDGDPLDGQVGFARDVDFCSACFLAVDRACWGRLGGFDEALASGASADSDFCLRLWQDGKRVLYDPRIVVWHCEEKPRALERRNQRYLAAKHRSYLSRCPPSAPANVERARLRHVPGPRVLFVEDRLPEAARGLGFERSAAIARELQQSAGLVSMLGLHNNDWPEPHRASAGRTEVLSGINASNIGALFADRCGVYDLLWLSRTHNLPWLHAWRRAHPEFFAGLRIVLDAAGIAAPRLAGYAQQAGQPLELTPLVDEELEHLDGIERICVVSELDRELVLRSLERRALEVEVSLLGHSLPAVSEPPTFDQTCNIVLSGAFSDLDGPNADGLIWFDREIRPLLTGLKHLHFVIAGAQAEEFVSRVPLQHSYVIHSDVPDMSAVYRNARVVVAPTRFAAGAPMKVHEASSHGVPVVMTELLGRQLGWSRYGVVAVPAEAQAMASAIERLARDATFWRQTQTLQLELIERDCDPRSFSSTLRQILAPESAHAGAQVITLPVRRHSRRIGAAL